jgi:hypothetical protein
MFQVLIVTLTMFHSLWKPKQLGKKYVYSQTNVLQSLGCMLSY